jgi:hypothetical protein
MRTVVVTIFLHGRDSCFDLLERFTPLSADKKVKGRHVIGAAEKHIFTTSATQDCKP